MLKYASQLSTLVLSRRYIPIFLCLSDADAGRLIKALLVEFRGGNAELDDENLQQLLVSLSEWIDEGARRYIERTAEQNTTE